MADGSALATVPTTIPVEESERDLLPSTLRFPPTSLMDLSLSSDKYGVGSLPRVNLVGRGTQKRALTWASSLLALVGARVLKVCEGVCLGTDIMVRS